MSDEIEDLVGRLLDWPYQGETMAEEAAVLIKQLTAERDRLREALLCGRRLWAIAQDDRIRLLIQLEQCEDRNE
jgi:hypothetical protein